MTADIAIDLVRQATLLGLIVAAPVLVASVVVGLVVGILQAVTQVQEQTLSFVPRLVVVALTMLLMLPWSIERLVEFSATLYRGIPSTF
jgi:flagellar biosynthetic protein FliQ